MGTPTKSTSTTRSNGITVLKDTTTSLIGSSEEPDTSPSQRTWWKRTATTLHRAGKAYSAALLITGVLMPFIASVATIAVYVAPPINVFQQILPFLPMQISDWYAPVYGVLLSSILWLFAALCSCSFTTAGGANMGSYSQMREHWLRLKARLGLQEDEQGNLAHMDMDKLRKEVGLNISEPYQTLALQEAYALCHGISRNLCGADTGLRWALGSGYTSTWSLIHRAEEALIEIEPGEMVLRGAMHDMFSIKGSTMNNGDELLDK